jgi:2-hydroxychromene-2-carboxylate isomerase
MATVADWYFDVLSPYVYLQLTDLARISPDMVIVPKPILLGVLFNHWGGKAPAEIPAKRLHVYRQCVWLARERKIPFLMPPQHPFNPLGVSRLLCALGPTLEQARVASEFVFAQGRDLSKPEELQRLGEALGVEASQVQVLSSSPEAKSKLRANTDEAIARRVWGVPTFFVREQVFWGADSLPMLLEFLRNPGLFDTPEMQGLPELPVGVVRA